MMILVLAAYSLLALPVHGQIHIKAAGLCARSSIVLRALGVSWRRERPIVLQGKKTGEKPKGALRVIKGAAKIQRIFITSRVGTGDAMQTAMAVGAVRAGVFAALGTLGVTAHARVSVLPDYRKPGFELHACCIFSMTLGDIIYSAAREAVKKRGKEGTRWSSIPLRA